MVDRLKDKVALVVGVGSIGPGWGNGKATAVAFAREGARVFCADVNQAAAEETAAIIKGEGGNAMAHRADASKAADVAMVQACASEPGGCLAKAHEHDRIGTLPVPCIPSLPTAENKGCKPTSTLRWPRNGSRKPCAARTSARSRPFHAGSRSYIRRRLRLNGVW